MVQALQAENLAEAQLMFEEALKKDDENTLADLGNVIIFRFLEEAKQIFQQLLEQFPDADGLNIPLAEIAIENNEIDDRIYLEKFQKLVTVMSKAS